LDEHPCDRAQEAHPGVLDGQGRGIKTWRARIASVCVKFDADDCNEISTSIGASQRTDACLTDTGVGFDKRPCTSPVRRDKHWLSSRSALNPRIHVTKRFVGPYVSLFQEEPIRVAESKKRKTFRNGLDRCALGKAIVCIVARTV